MAEIVLITSIIVALLVFVATCTHNIVKQRQDSRKLVEVLGILADVQTTKAMRERLEDLASRVEANRMDLSHVVGDVTRIDGLMRSFNARLSQATKLSPAERMKKELAELGEGVITGEPEQHANGPTGRTPHDILKQLGGNQS